MSLSHVFDFLMNFKDIKFNQRVNEKNSRQVGSICLLPTLFGLEPEPDLAASFVPGSCRKGLRPCDLRLRRVSGRRLEWCALRLAYRLSASASNQETGDFGQDFLCNPSVSNTELGPLLFVLHTMAKLPCRYYGLDRSKADDQGPPIFVPMFRNEAKITQCSIVKSIVETGLVESFFSRFFPPSALFCGVQYKSRFLYLCVLFLSSVLKLWAIAGT